MTQTGNKLIYQPFSSILNPGFWQQLTSVKLNELKLDIGPINVQGTYSFGLSSNLPCLASFDHGSFNVASEIETRTACPLYGTLVCFNLLQEMIDFDKKRFLDSIGQEIWSSILDGRALTEPEKHLSRFGVLVYADLKKYIFTYWFAFPALNYPNEVHHSVNANSEQPQQPITKFFSDEALQIFQDQYDAPSSNRSFKRGYFIVAHNEQADTVTCLGLDEYKSTTKDHSESKIYFAFSDASPNNQYPGWSLRNFLALIVMQFQLRHINLIRVRRGQPSGDQKSYLHHSFVFDVECELDDSLANLKDQRPIVSGWEKNESQQLAPKRVNLSSLLDPKKLANDAVNLNLKLMKWRLLPSLDLDSIAETRCLLLGCGTLGCHIARGLLSWGVKHISLVDNSKISYSNPVRQSLYTFEDCVRKTSSGSSSGAFYKAEAAAASLRKIHPTIDVESYVMSIPMPGHHVVESETEQIKKSIDKLEELIDKHDVIFLLMDTRESRWLPTVISMAKKKLVINAAIGFDTFLLQRFGIRDYLKLTELDQLQKQTRLESPSGSAELASNKLGCYFCNDIVAPGDSTLDRTLDQQCTVSRPGVSMMVSAMAVEFFASIVSSSRGCKTPAPLETQYDPSVANDDEDPLGIVPHSIRGNISRYYIYMPTSPCFNKCSACSQTVIGHYLEHRFNFLIRVFNEPSYLEEVAGLKDLKNVSDDVWALDSDEEPSE